MNVNNYLKRFNAHISDSTSLSDLTQLQKLHLQHVPFENLDVLQKVPIYLNLETIFKKIVHANRGGYCYELNGLFQWLLTELGYDANLVAATVLKPDDQWAKADTHAAIVVQLDEPYLVDVGFGAATPTVPVPLNKKSVNDVRATYSIERVNPTEFDLIRESNREERILYRFKDEKKELIYFHEGCVFNQVSQDSTFTHHDIVTRATENGQITLNDLTLSHLKGGSLEKEIISNEEKAYVLQKFFNISI